jgi:hypothetical protein
VVESVDAVNVAPVVVEPPVQAVPPAPPVNDAELETWATRHADAAKALGAWAHNNPEAAAEIFTWDAKQPAKSRGLVHWAIRHPSEDITVLTGQHPEWSWFGRVMAAHRMGADQYLDWCRKYPAAADELVRHGGGVRWVGDHLYASEWRP